MYWADSSGAQADRHCEVINVAYSLTGQSLPSNHGCVLLEAIVQHLPWFGTDELSALHLIDVAPNANGWQKAAIDANQELQLSKRTRLILRVARHRLPACAVLQGKTLSLGGYVLDIGTCKARELLPAPTVFCRYLIGPPASTAESAFLDWVAGALHSLGVNTQKLLCGRSAKLTTPDGSKTARSLMVAALSAEQSLLLQSRGLGAYQLYGCGLFVAHKDVAPITSAGDRDDY